jgi:signal transduction histidine kinase
MRILRGTSSTATSSLAGAKFEAVERQIVRLTNLVNNLLDVSRISTHKLQLDYEPVDLAELAREVCGRLTPEAVRAGCMLAVHTDGEVPGTWDRVRLDQVVTNLVTNAVKYGAGKPIEVSVRRQGASARLLVCDHGIGIDPEDQARIFDRFERAVSEHHYGGLGLGLWIVRQILDALGGTIRVESQRGKGATFIVVLPRDRA